MLGKFFDWLGGGKREEEPGQEVLYKDYSIRPTARRDGGHWLTAGVITKTFEAGVSKEHHFISAETHDAKSAAAEVPTIKGKKIVDEFGDRMFK